jgi:hypothetical protein
MTDFTFTNHGTVWAVVAGSEAAKDFANEHFGVESWQGAPCDFVTDWRPARDLADRLEDEGFLVDRV